MISKWTEFIRLKYYIIKAYEVEWGKNGIKKYDIHLLKYSFMEHSSKIVQNTT